ncbi:MAG TPA: glycerate kinase [Phycisphaerae bacterium]|nr:glycerate kinase [Phycisphaerae bacterium]
MRVVIAPDSFKTALDAASVARCMAEGVRRARPDAEIVEIPMADGGEGTLEVLVNSARGNRRRVAAHDPLGRPIQVTVGLINQAATAVIELAQVSGYGLVPPDKRDPLITSTVGLGEVIRAVLDAEIEDAILAVGGSATVDGGAGMMQALGLDYFDRHGHAIEPPCGGGKLVEIERFIWDEPPAGLDTIRLTVACDVLNPACGPHGAAVVFGPQKGASPEAVRLLDEGLSHWAELLEHACGRPLRNEPGTGAAGGVALPLLAFTSAVLVPGVDLVAEAVGLAGAIGDADLVLTGEGCVDGQSLMGKVVGAVARMSRSAAVPCVAICGKKGPGSEQIAELLDDLFTLDAPIEETQCRLKDVAQSVAAAMI